MANKTSQHILSTSANLIGFCMVVITALHFTNKRALTIVDELIAIILLLLAAASTFSFLSIRSQKATQEQKFETIADFLFFFALMGIVVIILFITTNLIS